MGNDHVGVNHLCGLDAPAGEESDATGQALKLGPSTFQLQSQG